MAENVNTFVEWVEHDSVRPTLNIDRLDHRQSLRIPHDDGLTRSEPMTRLRIDGSAARNSVRNFADRFKRIKIEDRDPSGNSSTRNVQTTAIHVRIDVIEITCTANARGFQNFVRTRGCAWRAKLMDANRTIAAANVKTLLMRVPPDFAPC